MKSRLAAMVAAAGLCPLASAVQNSRLVFQVSTDNVSWGTSVEVMPGQTVYARSLLTYTGSNQALGLSSAIFQPTISNWRPQDTLMPFINGGFGSNTSTPSGALSPAQVADSTSFGRISPFAGTNMSATQAIRGHYHVNPNGDTINYLRIAQQQVTSWFGGFGNTTGGSGVNFRQLSQVGRTATDPAFNGATTNVAVFKYGFSVDPASPLRTLTLTTPAEWMGNRNSTTGEREVYWYLGFLEALGSDRGSVLIVPANVHVIPAPGAGLAAGVGVGTLLRRRRR